MIDFAFEHNEIEVKLDGYQDWLRLVAESQRRNIREITYIFTTDQQVLKLNQAYLDHDYFTDILTFDRSDAESLEGDIYISLDRVKENAVEFDVEFEEELRRVMAHGILHMVGLKDGTDKERRIMREAEEVAMKLFHVKQ